MHIFKSLLSKRKFRLILSFDTASSSNENNQVVLNFGA